MPMDNVTLENTQQSISSRDAKSVASVMVNGKWVNLSDTLEQANVKSNVGTVAKQVAAQQEAVSNAASTADSAVAYANDAIEKSKVNSQAIDDINSAVSDAASDAAVARSDGLRAWNAAQSNVNLIDLNYASASAAISSARTEAIAAADEAKTSASAAQAGIVAVRSSVAAVQADVTATRSDVAVAKSDIADTKTTLAQTASDLNSKISGVETSLADTTSALSDAKTEFNSDVAEAKNLANAAQTTADSAVKSASSVANDLTAVASQAKSNADGITKVTSDMGLLQTTVADNSGNISTIQETAKQIQQAVSDNAGNITVAKQTADSAVAVASDAKSNATVAVQTASQASITATNASGQAASAVLTANGAMTTASNANSYATVAVQTASGASLTAINATNDATVAKQTASEAKVQASNAESDFAQISIRAGQIEASVANNSGAIASVQQTANGLTTTVADIKANGGGVNLLQGTGTVSGDVANSGGGTLVQGAFNGYDAVKTNRAWTGQFINLQSALGRTNAKVGDWYTISIYVKADKQIDTSSLDVYRAIGNDYGLNLYTIWMQTKPITTQWQQYSWSFQIDDNSLGKTNTRVEYNSDNGDNWIYWAGWMLEKGTVAHDWSPAPEDLQNQFTQVKQTVDGITTTVSNIQGDVSQLKVSASSASVALSDAAGNISSLQATATSYSAALSDTNSNVASVTATASELETKYADAAGDISTLQADAKGMTQTISDAQGDIANLKTRADGFDTQFSNINGNINKIQTDATGTTQTLANTKSDVAVLQSRADGFDAKYATAAGDINTLKTNASGFSQTLTNAQGDISTLKSTVTGVQTTLTDAQGNISTLQSDVSGLKKTTSDNAGNISTLQATANTLTSQMSSTQGDISTLKQTASDFSSKVSGMETSLADTSGKINAIQANGGGRNLLQGTGTVSGDVAGGGGTLVEGAFNGYDAVKTNGAWSERCINLQSSLGRTNAKAGDWYTISVYVKADKQIDTGGLYVPRALGDGDDGWLSSISMQDKPITTQWQQYSWSFQINNNSLREQTTRVEYNYDTDDNWIYWAGWMLEKGMVAHDWSPAPEDVDAKITANTTAINQNKQAIALKADQTTVDKTNGTVQQLQSQLQVQAGQIATKVSSSDLDAKGYATQEYTQTQIKQTSDSWNANLASVKDGLTQSYTNLSASVDGIKADVYNSDGSSKITQLSNLIATKVSQGDYNSQITQLNNDINLRVKSADLISQINLQAGATLIQSNKLVLDAGTTVFTGDAFIPSAAIANLTADDITTGTLKGVDIDFRNSSGQGVLIKDSTVTFDDGSSGDKAGYLSFSSMPIADWPSGAGGNELQIRYGESLAIVATSDTDSRALFSTANTQIGYHQQGNSSSDWGLTGLKIDNSARHFNLGVWATDSTWARVEATPHNIQMQANDAHAWLYNNNFHIYKDNDGGSATATELQVDGWAWVRGWVEAAGHSQHSALSTKTDLQTIDDDEMLEMVNNTDLASFLFKTDVASGETHRHIGLIIDDVHDVAQYQAPQDFIAPNGVSRDDDNMIGALFGAVKALTKRIKTLESKVG